MILDRSLNFLLRFMEHLDVFVKSNIINVVFYYLLDRLKSAFNNSIRWYVLAFLRDLELQSLLQIEFQMSKRYFSSIGITISKGLSNDLGCDDVTWVKGDPTIKFVNLIVDFLSSALPHVSQSTELHDLVIFTLESIHNFLELRVLSF